jgi:DNA-binding transcriptional LysR family regulator
MEHWQMELRHLRYFTAVAEELSFTRAAERLGIKQPPLSLQIRQLEKELGAPLFRRLTRGVELTGAGKLLLAQARVILGQVEKAKTDVRRRARGETGRLNVGSSGATYFHPLVPTIIRAYGTQYPDVVLAPEASNTVMLTARLQAGAVDVAFVRPPVSDCDPLAFEPLAEEGAVMILPTAHARLFGNLTSAPLSVLAKETFILWPRALNPSSYDAIIAACRHAGFEPMLGQPAPQMVSIIPLVAAGLGVSIAPRSLSRIHADGVFYLPIDGDEPRSRIALAYRRNDHSPAVRSFVAVARREALTAAQGGHT